MKHVVDQRGSGFVNEQIFSPSVAELAGLRGDLAG